MALNVLGYWLNNGGLSNPAIHDSAMNADAGVSGGSNHDKSSALILWGQSTRTALVAIGLIYNTPYIDNFNHHFRWNVDDTVNGTVQGKIRIYEQTALSGDFDLIIEYDTGMVTCEGGDDDVEFTIGQAEGDGTNEAYIVGDADTTIGDYGQTNAYKFAFYACDDGTPDDGQALSDPLWSGGISGGLIADAEIGFYTPPYFLTAYPDEFINDGFNSTGEHYTLVQSITDTSAYIVVNTPHLISGNTSILYSDDNWVTTQESSISSSRGIKKIPLTGLTPNTEYKYTLGWYHWMVGTPDDIICQDKTFKTLAPAGVSTKVVFQADTHRVFADVVSERLANVTYNKIKEHGPDFIVDLGDTQGGDLSGAFFQNEFDLLYQMSNSTFQRLDTPIQFHIPGNHESLNPYYQNVTTEQLTISTGHRRPWQDISYAGISRDKYFASLGDATYKTYATWEHGDAVYICIDPYMYTEQYPQDNGENCTFTLGAVQQAWFANIMATTTKKWKYIIAHQHLGGENAVTGTTGCYGKGSSGTFDKGQNLTEIYPYITDPKHTIMFLGHDHLYMIDKYEDLLFVRVPTYGNQGGGQTTWNQNQYGYNNSRKFFGAGVTNSGAKHGYFKAEIASALTFVSGITWSLTYNNASGEENLSLPEVVYHPFYYPSTLTNVTRDKQLNLIYASDVFVNGINESTQTITVKVQASDELLDQEKGWRVGDEIGILYHKMGFLVVDTTADKTVIEMIDIDGVPVPNSKITIRG